MPFGLYPVSILKPLKGADAGLRENIRSFFKLRYPVFEIIFSVADARDPARAVVEELIRSHPEVDARLIVGGVDIGPNPKINNLVRSYESAKYDLVLISDSNVRVEPDYLKRVVAHLETGVGVVTAVVAGRDGDTLGGRLEATYLNTFYARWMFIAKAGGNPCVVGKSMLFSRSVAARFGGIRALACYLAEDYMAGQAMRALGLTVEIQSQPINQHIGNYSLRDFWQRHVRWGRIRKAQAPLAFVVEPLTTAVISGAIGAAAFYRLCGLSPALFALVHFGAWSLCDLWLHARLNGGLRAWMPLSWALRELLSIPLWVHTAAGNTVKWRGRELALGAGGLLMTPEEEHEPVARQKLSSGA